jgi:hypothetical protein
MRNIILRGAFAGFLMGMLSPLSSFAAGPSVIVTWKASGGLVPDDFAGRVLPAAGSLVTASAEVLLENGALADLSGEILQWYANNKLIEGGKGVQKITFRAPELSGGLVHVRVQLPNFNDAFLSRTATVPVAKPLAVIEAPLAESSFSNSVLRLKAHPYYFTASSASSLTFAWSINGSPPDSSDNPEELAISIDPKAPSGAPVNVRITIANPAVFYEAAEAARSFLYKK